MSNADLTEERQADARRLAAILDAWKAENRRGHTQTRLARLCGWTQTTVSQYKHGVIPLNRQSQRPRRPPEQQSGGLDTFPGGHGPRAFFLRVEGDSMENPGGPHSFREGELILVDPDGRARHRDFVVAVVDGGRATFKQLIDADGERYLKAINPGWHRPRIDLPPGDRGIIDVAVKKIVDIA